MRCKTGNHPCKIDSCNVCEEIMYWVDCPTGGWWKHVDHPYDDHDGAAPGAAPLPEHAEEN